MTHMELLVCTLGLALGAGLPRVLPLTFLADRSMPPRFQRWLSFVPAAILAALVAPEIFMADGRLFLSLDNIFLLASLPTLLLAWKTRSLFVTLATGMLTVACMRWWFG